MNRQELSRFKKKAEKLTDLNKARRNMLNWIQPDLILTRCVMSLTRYFRRESTHAFELIKESVNEPQVERSWLSNNEQSSIGENTEASKLS
jgi:hypothetical protein